MTINRVCESIKNKKCQCGEQLKAFLPSGFLLIPLTMSVHFSQMNKAVDYDAVYPFINTPLMAAWKLCFSSTCASCGNISFWNLTSEEVKAIISDEMRKDGYGILHFYKSSTIQKMIDNTNSETIKENLEVVLKNTKDFEELLDTVKINEGK